MNHWRDRVVSVAHRRTAYQIALSERPATGPVLVFLHGLGCSRADFRAADRAPALATHALAAFDFPGHGDSGYPGHLRLTVADLAELARGVVESMMPREVVIVGHSLGGLVGLLVARARPDWLRAFITVEGNLAPEDCTLTREVARHRYPDPGGAYLAELEARLSASDDPGWSAYGRRFRQRVCPRAFYDYSVSTVAYSDQVDLLSIYLALEVPTLFVHGSRSPRPSYLGKLRAHARAVACIPDSGHFPTYCNPGAFYQTLGDVLR